jgi:DNA-binding response OmpR family regulator
MTEQLPEREQPVVLAADDDDEILELVAFRLERSGYTVLLARDGQEALDLALEVRPDLAVFDVMMPKLDGVELTRRLRAEEATRRMPIILLTARAQDRDVERGFEAGADDYMRKPFSPRELGMRVQSILGRT